MEALALNRVNLYKYTKDIKYLERPYFKLNYDRTWTEDHDVPKLAMILAINQGLFDE